MKAMIPSNDPSQPLESQMPVNPARVPRPQAGIGPAPKTADAQGGSPEGDPQAWSEAMRLLMLLNTEEIVYSLALSASNVLHSKFGFISAAVEGLLGYHPAEFTSDPTLWQSLVHPEDVAGLAVTTAAILATGEPGSRTYRLRHKLTGAYHWLEDRIMPQRDAGGRLTAIFGVARDITTRKRVEDSLRLEGAALEAAANAVFITDREGIINWVNPAFTRLSGYTTAEAIGRKPNLVRSGAHDESFYRQIWQTVLTGQAWHGQITNRRKTGELYISEQTIAPVKCAAGRITHFVSVQQDITARRQAEDELRWKTAFFEAQVDAALDGILVVDSAGKTILQNQRMLDMWGISPGPEEDAGQFRRLASQTRNAGQFLAQVAHLFAHPDEVSRDEIELHHGRVLERYSAPVRDKAGTHFGRIWTFRDISERLKMEEQFRQAQKMDSIGQLAGGVAHDFNNLLAVILAHSELISSVPNLPGEVIDGLEGIHAAARKAASLTRQLLLFSRRQVMQPTALDLNEAVTNLAKMLQRIIGEDVQLQLQLHPAPLPARADAGMLDQVLLNLAVNARDAMPEGGRLLIGTKEQIVDEDSGDLGPDARPGRYLCLTVSDTGRGIPPEVIPRIFEPFFTTKEPGKGTGLGLATVFGIVKQHQGWLRVTSQPGEGTSFQVFLPASGASPRAADRGPGPANPRGGAETILLAEDDDALRDVTRLVMERHGYRVIAAASGEEALALWEKHRGQVRLLLTDLVMPGGLTGHQLARRLQADERDLKVIYTSGYSTEIAGKELALRPGENFVQKPYCLEQLLETIRKSLDD